MYEILFKNASLAAALEHNGAIESLGAALLPDWHLRGGSGHFDRRWAEIERTGRGDFVLLRDEAPESKELDELMHNLGCAEARIEQKATR